MKKNSFYFLAVALIIVMLSIVSITITRTMFGSFFNQPLCKFFFNHLADAILLLAPYWLLRRWRHVYAFIIVWIIALWCFIQLLYFPTYHDVMPFASFLLVDNLSPTLINSSIGAITKKSIIVLLMPLALHAYHWYARRKGSEKPMTKSHWLVFAASIAAFVILRLAITTCIYLTNRQNYSDLHDAFSTRYCKLGGRHRNYIMHNGVMSYAIYSLVSSFNSGVSDKEWQTATSFINKNCPSYTDNLHATTIENPNIIFIMVESLNAWAVNLNIDGKPVTPTLNALVADTTDNIVCLNMISQAKNGHSSDGKFMYLTGLLPLLDKSVAMEFADRDYPSMVKALKQRGYAALEIAGDESGLWNVEQMSKTYGFDTLYHQPELEKQLKAASYLIDKVVMEHAAKLLPAVRQPFMAQLFTGVMHSPYTGTWEYPTWISASKQYTPAVRHYLEKTAFFDAQLGMFLERLKQSDIYDNSIIVVASDHSEPVDDDSRGRPSISKNGNECVFIVINAAKGKFIQGPIGQIDVYPTVLDVIGLNSYRWKGLGHSLLRYDIHSVAESNDETTGNSDLIKQQKQAWTVSDILIKANRFN